MNIRTERLELVDATPQLLEQDSGTRAVLGSLLGARIPESWPPELLDESAIQWVKRSLHADPRLEGWLLYYVLLVSANGAELVGAAGFKGRPDDQGIVEIGYGVVADHRRRGIASEAAQALVAHAFGFPEVLWVTAGTFPEHEASLGVMRRCGMRFLRNGSEPGTVLYGVDREQFERSGSGNFRTMRSL